jgi:1-acyl-sn-glycerol-3-phosphate acyltransferase
VTGADLVPRTGGLILAPNHNSYADPPLVGYASPRVVWFMAKAHLFRNRLLALGMRAFHAYPVDVDGVDREALRFTERLLRDGEVVCIFPEGSVSDDGRLMPLKPGLALLSLRAGVPIVPMALIRTNRLLPPDAKFVRFAEGGIRIEFGEPIHPASIPSGLERRAAIDWLTARLDDALRALLAAEHQPPA